MEIDRFRLIIVGAGAISRVAHVPAALASPIVKLVGIVDPDINRAQALCREFGLSAAIGPNVDQLGVPFDGAIVATPNHLHAPVATSLIQNGAPVLIEKPMAIDVATARELARLATEKKVTVAVGYHTRHSGACQTLKYAVDSGHFGRALRFAHQDGSRGGWSPMSGYNLNTQYAGGGVLVTTGTHLLDRLIWLWGAPVEVSFRDNAEHGPESHCIARFEFRDHDNTIPGAAIFSKVISLSESTVVETTDGLLIMPSDAAETITFRPRRDPALEYEVKLTGHGRDPRSLYQRQLEDFVRSCRTGARPCVDAAQGALSVELVHRLYAARKPLAEHHQPATEAPAHA